MNSIKSIVEWFLAMLGLSPIEDLENQLKYAWTYRLLAVAGLLTGMEAALPFVDQWIYVPRWLMALLTMIVICAAFIARSVAQNNLRFNKDTQEDEHKS
jgi:hypothetical protein